MSSKSKDDIYISIIIPAYNEDESLPHLYEQMKPVLEQVAPGRHEIIIIDDGSTDATLQCIRELHESDDCIRGFAMRKNFGKAQALSAGFAHARGEIIFTLDADMQDDPDEIPRFIDKLDEGFDLVSGWKARRKDPFIKVISSRLYNWVNDRVFGLKLHDMNCGFKAYKRIVIEETELYGELHRYIPIIAHSKGFRVAEIAVKHHPRKFGKTKYNWKRYTAGFYDMLTSIVITKFSRKPLHFFGSFGTSFFAAGFLICLKLSYDWFVHEKWLGDRPLLILGVLLLIVGLQVIMTGLIAEIVINHEEKFEKRLPIRKIISSLEEDQDAK